MLVGVPKLTRVTKNNQRPSFEVGPSPYGASIKPLHVVTAVAASNYKPMSESNYLWPWSISGSCNQLRQTYYVMKGCTNECVSDVLVLNIAPLEIGSPLRPNTYRMSKAGTEFRIRTQCYIEVNKGFQSRLLMSVFLNRYVSQLSTWINLDWNKMRKATIILNSEKSIELYDHPRGFCNTSHYCTTVYDVQQRRSR